MTIIKSFLILLFLNINLIFSSQNIIYNLVNNNLNKYGQYIENEEITFDNGIIRLVLDGRRTNIKSQLLLGYYSIGLAIQSIEIFCNTVEVVINYEMKNETQVISRAAPQKVIQLSMRQISPEKFFLYVSY